MERWLPIDGYEGVYEVSDQGRVRSLDRVDTSGRRRAGVVLAQVISSTGYHQVGLHYGGATRTMHVHRLVMLTFAGPEPEGMEVRHLDGDRTNSRLANLAWGTHAENMQDQRAHGTHRNTVKTHCPAGHPYVGENLMVDRDGHRRCAICRRQDWLRVSARRSAERRAA